MNQEQEKSSPHDSIDSLTIMRLVDGELSPSERSRVIRALESQSDGWRDCALAFLEDQALSRALGPTRQQTAMPAERQTVASTGLGSETVEVIRRPVARDVPDKSSWKSVLATAATILCAFAVGWFGSRGRLGGRPAPENIVGKPYPEIDNDQLRQATPPTTLASQPETTLAGTYSVPASRFWEQESVIPADVRRALADQGTQIRHERGLMPYWLPDGKRVTIPYEDVQLVPVNRVSY